jgi:hypothetical protein
MKGFLLLRVLFNVRNEPNDDRLKQILQSWKIRPQIPGSFADVVWDTIEQQKLHRAESSVSAGSRPKRHYNRRNH